MEIALSPSSILPLAAAANGLLLALALGLRARARGARTGLVAAGFLLSAALATAAITIDHAALAETPSWIGFVEAGATLAAGPMFFLFIAALTGFRAPVLIALAPAIVAVAIALLIQADPHLVAERFVFLQIGYTAAAFAVIVRQQHAEAKRLQLALVCLGGAGVIHTAQIARFLWPDLALIRDLIPYAGALAFFALATAVYASARLKALDQLFLPPPRIPDGAPLLLAQIDDVLRQTCGDSDLSIDGVGSGLGAPSSDIEAALKAVRGVTFRDALRNARVVKAKGLLRDPAEARTSMEAIGLLSGFRSRSVFYDAFRTSTGMTPAAYRKTTREESCPEA